MHGSFSGIEFTSDAMVASTRSAMSSVSARIITGKQTEVGFLLKNFYLSSENE